MQAKLTARLEAADASSAAHRASVEDLLRMQLNNTLILLNSSSGSLVERLEQLHSQLLQEWRSGDAQQLAAAALVQGWALGVVVAGTSAAASAIAGGSGATQPGMLSLHRAAEPVSQPAWPSFKPHTCLRLQNFGNAEGYSAAVFGANPCTAVTGAPLPGNDAATGEALRWGSHASFLLDCSHGDGSLSSEASTETDGSFQPLSGRLQAAGAAAAASVAAALDRTTSCRVAVGSDSGSGALLAHAFERPPLLAAPKLDALRIRICNM
jgi:hypothetical protein